MTRYRRSARRQGVVYGPVLDMNPNQQPSGVGRLLGALVVAGALLLMGVATFAFLGRGQPPAPGASPSPTGVALASPSPDATPTVPSSPLPTAGSPSPTPAITLPPTAEPSPSPLTVEVRQGPGFVTFGSSWNNSYELQNISATFSPGGRIAWSAVLEEPVAAPAVDVRVLRLDPEQGEEQLTFEERYEVESQSSERFLRRVRINLITDGPGVYAVRYLRDGEVIAEGLFRLLGDEGDGDDDDD